MKFSLKTKQKIYCEYVNQSNQEKSASTIALVSDFEFFNISVKTTFDIDNAEKYDSSLALC